MAIEDMVGRVPRIAFPFGFRKQVHASYRVAMTSPMPDTMKRTGARTGTYICVSI